MSNISKVTIHFVIFILIGSILLLCCCENKKNEMFKITRYEISTEKDIADLRIILISDLHLKEYGNDNEILLNEISNLKPDIILSVGDHVIAREKNFDSAISFLNKASEIAPTYFSSGNHEWTAIYHYKNYELAKALNGCNATWLNNTKETITIEGNELLICGIYDEPDADFGYANKAIPSFNDEDDRKFKLLLNHCPMTISNTKVTPKADLVLSGHEHGGQIVIPFTNQGLYSKNQGFFPKYTRGLNTIANNTVIISAGLSNSYHWIPRINNQPELVVIDVN